MSLKHEKHLLQEGGKSTFASKLGKILDIPVHHLDRHMFEPGGKKRDKKEFIETQKVMLEEKAWIVEGCSFSTIVPTYRKKMVGKNMAFAVFNKHPGPWRIRQISGSELATKFWRRVIGEYTNENYTESQIDNPPWGLSICQKFNNQN